MQSFRLQDLPVELERSILEIAARLDLKTAMNLSLVCHQIKDWTQPFIYEMVTLGAGDIALFLRTMEMFPVDFFAQSVKRLCLTVSVKPIDARRILQACTGISSLACWVDFIGWTPSIPFRALLHPLPLRRLSIEVAHFKKLSLPECAWIHSLTCLDLIFWREDSLLISELRFLPALTHLALKFLQHPNIEDSALVYILSVAPALQALCLVTDEDDLEMFEHTKLVDLRVVCVPHPESVIDWEASYRGRLNMWSQVEGIIEQRRFAENRVRAVQLHLVYFI
ncbi:hypothetical protein J3R30DRAFT_3276980 [Lentinula aciculospora]|uniref:F-box domain-containing protein n=1 Tax=Lentinula aciculospora TaxID=153920 RepID=A0A9W9AW74_9AGAR|nr:hypothetical protein J3R30DRAFT_3276980 [Lentinula aciculospora]